jgi:hypothetical protein
MEGSLRVAESIGFDETTQYQLHGKQVAGTLRVPFAAFPLGNL